MSCSQPWSALLAHEHEAVRRTGDRAAYVYKVALSIHALNAQADRRVALRTHMSRHLLALDDARRIGARTDGTRFAMPRVAVRVRSAVEAVTLHDALETATLRCTRDAN